MQSGVRLQAHCPAGGGAGRGGRGEELPAPEELPEVEIISVEKDYRPREAPPQGRSEAEEPEEPGVGTHRPAVSTWGVFERPADISKAYGGGRTLRPGQALEAEEVTEQKARDTEAALERFRQKSGLVVDPELEAAAQTLVEQGLKLQSAGRLEPAAEAFREAAEILPFKTQLAGEATLLQGTCLDSLGKRDEARAVYTAVQGHPNEKTAKQASRLLFGFTAEEDMKVEGISMVVEGGQFEPLFRPLSKSWGATLVPSDSDAEGEASDAGGAAGAVAALALLGIPVLFVLSNSLK